MLIRIRDSPVEGWERRFTADPQRAEEVMELYRRLGYEVRAEPASRADEADECDACHASAPQWKTIYTRKKSTG